jgi:hypothetical protein
LTKSGITPRGLILTSPYISIPDVAFEFNLFQVLPLLKPIQYFPAIHDYLKASIQDRFDSLSHLRYLETVPVLIVHGVKDREIPCHHSRLLFKGCVSAHENYKGYVRWKQSSVVVKGAAGGGGEAVVVKEEKFVEEQYVSGKELYEVMKGGKWLDGVEELDGGWGMEGKRWCSVLEGIHVEGANSEVVGKVSIPPRGPPKAMLVELHHAHHNNVQSHGELLTCYRATCKCGIKRFLWY